MSGGQVPIATVTIIKERRVQFRRDNKDKWTKAYAKLVSTGAMYSLRLLTSKAENSPTLLSITISKEAMGVIGPGFSEDKSIFHIVNGKKEVHILDKNSHVQEWCQLIDSIASRMRGNDKGLSFSLQELTEAQDPVVLARSPRIIRKDGLNSVINKTRNRSVSLGGAKKKHSITPNTGSGSEDNKWKRRNMKFQGIAFEEMRARQLEEDAQKLIMDDSIKDMISGVSIPTIPKYNRFIDTNLNIDISSDEDQDAISEEHSNNEAEEPVNVQEKENEEINEAKRKWIASEIYTTEQSYVNSLNYVIRFFMEPLIKNAESYGESQATIAQIFGNIKTLYNYNSQLLEEIQKIISTWEGSFGEMFIKMIPFLKIYTAYSNNYAFASEIQERMMNNEKWKREIFGIAEASESKLKLSDYLIMPVQRIPRYSLLLKDLLSNTSKSNPDYKPLVEAYKSIGEVATHINEEVRRFENIVRISEMTRKGIDLGQFIEPSRSLVKDGIFKVSVEPNPVFMPDLKPVTETRHFVLFNDCFIQMRKDNMKHGVDKTKYFWPLELVWLEMKENTVVVSGPTEKLHFTDKDDWANTLFNIVENRISQIRIHRNSKDNVKSPGKPNLPLERTGSFTYPDGSFYQGGWSKCLREGKGTFSSSGGHYVGYWKNDKMEGKGKLAYMTGDVYIGNWYNGKQHGKGVLKYKDDTTYIGNWVHGMRTGSGKIVSPNGTQFRGVWQNDKIIEGELQTPDGYYYVGNFLNNVFNGVGKLNYPDGSVYEGQFKNGQKDGLGKFKCANEIYQGRFENNLRHGTGECYYHLDGTTYNGNWAYDMYHGRGRYKSKTEIYIGDFVNGWRSGKGRYTDMNASVYYDGEWAHNRYHGEGELKDELGCVYKGTWVDGVKEGKGKFIFPNGSTYNGGVHRGMFHNRGSWHSKNDFLVTYEGEWNSGQMHGKGTATFMNGDTYTGSFCNHQFHGEGTYVSSSVTYEGRWEYGVLQGKLTLKLPELVLNGQASDNLFTPPTGWSVSIPSFLPNYPIVPVWVRHVALIEKNEPETSLL
eukprot:TRINITY_DN24046_c0_g1_i1.p1 TRINITY_DN24046_c0_g1~~TRINITY_DN24046_c0_g1_i1.p1  ORF type:complete len:1044 (-),score=206.88 TRINITY_DN24046_c0_g1_i1:52-3183(-)